MLTISGPVPIMLPRIVKDCEQEEYGRVAAQRADGWCESAL
jgi:hypothetical protein